LGDGAFGDEVDLQSDETVFQRQRDCTADLEDNRAREALMGKEEVARLLREPLALFSTGEPNAWKRYAG
jgi:hypothetical protein